MIEINTVYDAPRTNWFIALQRMVRRPGACVAVVATVATGCGGSDKPPNTPPDATTADATETPTTDDAATMIDAPAPDAPVTMIVSATETLHYVTDTGIVDRSEDLTGVTFASFTPTASGFERRTVQGTVDGTFALPVGIGAPAWLLEFGADQRLDRIFVASSAAHIDLSPVLLGRPDRRFPSLPTAVTINVTGLAPWQLSDELGVLSSNAGALSLDIEKGASLQIGDTALTGHVIAWPTRLIDAAKGDITTMFQLVNKTPPTGFSGTYVALVKSGPATGFTMVNGSPATMTVALANVPQTSTLSVHVKRSQFDALRTQVGPGALASEVFEQSLFIVALPHVREDALLAEEPRLVVAFPAPDKLDYDQSFVYGNPFTTGGVAWDELAEIRYNFRVPVLAAGATTPLNVPVGFLARIPVPALAADGTIAPTLTPVRNVKIAGRSLAEPQVGVGLTPTITWDPPLTGTPTSYEVSVRQVTADRTATTLRSIATFITTSTSLRLPDSVLSVGASYILMIDAEAAREYDPAKPFGTDGLPSFSATAATAQFTP
jgi:hypothetical protein